MRRPARESSVAGNAAADGSAAERPGMETTAAATPVAVQPPGAPGNHEVLLGSAVMVAILVAATQNPGYGSLAATASQPSPIAVPPVVSLLSVHCIPVYCQQVRDNEGWAQQPTLNHR